MRYFIFPYLNSIGFCTVLKIEDEVVITIWSLTFSEWKEIIHRVLTIEQWRKSESYYRDYETSENLFNMVFKPARKHAMGVNP